MAKNTNRWKSVLWIDIKTACLEIKQKHHILKEVNFANGRRRMGQICSSIEYCNANVVFLDTRSAVKDTEGSFVL